MREQQASLGSAILGFEPSVAYWVLEARRERKHTAEPRAETDKVLWFEVRLAPEEEEAVLVQRVSHLRRHRFARQAAAQADAGDLCAEAR